MAVEWYAIVDLSGNLISTGTVIATPEELAAQNYRAILLQGDPTGLLWDKDTETFVQPPVPNTVLPKVQFIQRFTAAEFAAIRASTDEQVQFFVYQLDNSTLIEPQAAAVQGPLAYLVQIGLLTQARADVIGAN